MRLSEIKDPTKDPVEIKDVVQAFPNTTEKAVRALAKSNRLMIGGLNWVDALQKMDTFIQKMAKKENDLELESISVDLHHDVQDFVEVEGLEVDEMQEVYLGYDVKADVFYVGYDAWISDDSRSEASEAAATEFIKDNDLEDDEFDKIANQIYRDIPSMVGLDFQVHFKDGVLVYDGPCHIPFPDGFYKKMYNQMYKNNPKIVDVRLD